MEGINRFLNWLKWLLALVGAALVAKAFEVLTTRVDGSGIGLYIFGIEINDRLPNEHIPRAAGELAATGILAVLMALGVHLFLARGRRSL